MVLRALLLYELASATANSDDVPCLVLSYCRDPAGFKSLQRYRVQCECECECGGSVVPE